MKRIAVVVALGLLSGCSLQPSSTARHGEALFGEVLKQPLLADSVLRDGDHLSYQAQIASAKTATTPDIAQIRASCTTPGANLLFVESPGTLAANGQPERFTVMRDLTAAVVVNLQQNPSFIEACARTPRPDWRVVSGATDGRWLLIDRASLKTTGDQLQFWGAFDEPLILINKLKKMPYAQQRMRLQASCSRQSYRTLATFGLTPSNVVTFGKTETAPQDQPFSTADTDIQALLKAACAPSAALEQLPVAASRTKVPQTVTPPAIPAQVLDAITALGLPSANKSLHHLVMRTDFGAGKLQSELFIEPDANSAQLRVREVGKYSTTQEVMFRGLFNLNYQAESKRDGLAISHASNVEQLSFTGDWKQMPVGATLGFSLKELNRNTAEEDRVLPRTDSCVIKRELPASKINGDLSGSAKELSCTSTGAKFITISTVVYLQDYGYFFTSKSDLANLLKTSMTLLKAE
ncbi:hypothetical protein [Pseudomonas sp. K2I15]|uniref:hypothetical protein n=1 Tax=unclassified Pseudomonas TaxID=196821 RepID=UPI000B4CA033|nr:hypothetical protein [Pseudomonas sp. K2I15]OWP69512.1 hypothetical protein CEC48_22475 [Pseudomonas sp. K2I15]